MPLPDKDEHCRCKCHQGTLGTARAASHMLNLKKSDLWYRRYCLEGIVGVEHADELEAFFACAGCLHLHCKALSGRPTPLWQPPPLLPAKDEDDGN